MWISALLLLVVVSDGLKIPKLNVVEEEMEDVLEAQSASIQSAFKIAADILMMRTLPDSLNWGDTEYLHPPIHQGAGCGSCGWVSGTQTLEARIALVTENYRAYSIQNFMNCDGRVCIGTIPYRVNSIARTNSFIVPEEEMPYVKKGCKHWGDKCHCAYKTGIGNYTNLLFEQFVIIGPTVSARSVGELIKALQTGPVTTCFQRGKPGQRVGELCKAGCDHANSIIGYTKTHFILQESYGQKWNGNGTWAVSKTSKCGQAVIKKAYYPVVYRDYDVYNAYFTEIKVNLETVQVLDKKANGVKECDTKNIGVAKNKCGFLGSPCKGVIRLPTGAVELVEDFGPKTRSGATAHLKTQMVVYLKNEASGTYLGVSNTASGGRPKLVLASEGQRAPFFTSNGRFISYEFPNFQLVDTKMKKIVGGIADVDHIQTWPWILKDCNLVNRHSKLSMDIVPGRRPSINTFGGRQTDMASPTQRFDIGLYGKWLIRANGLGGTMLRKGKRDELVFDNNEAFALEYFRWNARQITNKVGQPIGPDMKLTGGRFSREDSQNHIHPTGCLITNLSSDNLSVKKGRKIVLSSRVSDESRWTFEYDELD